MGPRSPWGGQIHRGYIQSWNGTFERQLPLQMIGSVGYVATRTIHQLIDRNINTVGPGIGTTTANLPLAKLYGRTIAHEHVGRHRHLQLPLAAGLAQQAVHATACMVKVTTRSASRSAWPTKTAGLGCRLLQLPEP